MLLSELWQDYLGLRLSNPRVFLHFSIALFFFAASCLLVISIVVSKIAKAVKARRLAKLVDKYDMLIGEVILHSENVAGKSFTERQQFLISGYRTKYLKTAWAQDAMIERMLDLKRSIEGNLEQKLIELYRALNLHVNSINKVKSPYWYFRVKGMKEVSEMQIDEARHLIIDQLSNSNKHVRREAQIALIKLSPRNPLYFLDQPGIFITRWQELRIHRFIKKYATRGVPSFKKWLGTKNPSVLKLVLRMISLFQQIDAADAVVGFLTHKDRGVRNAAVKTLLDLEAFQWSEAIYQAAVAHKDEIAPVHLTALSELFAGREVKELAWSMIENEDYALKKEAVRSLLKLGVAPAEITEGARPDTKPAIDRIIRHLNDPLLS